MNGRAWSDADLALLRELYPDLRAIDVARQLGRAVNTVHAKASQLGIKKSDAFNASDRSGRVKRGQQLPSMIATQFKPGQAPWSKGTKGLTGVQEGCRATQFKPGQRPHTWMPVGSYRIVFGGSDRTTRMLERKVNELPGPNHVRWHPVHRLVWEEANGPVPAGHIVLFKPGMRSILLDEITIDRLELVSRAEHARRNVPSRKHPEVAQLIRLKGAITRQVNRIAKQQEAIS